MQSVKKIRTGTRSEAGAFPFYAMSVGVPQRHAAGSRAGRGLGNANDAAHFREASLMNEGGFEVSPQRAGSGSGVASVWAAVCVRVVGTAPPSSSHRWISRRGSLCRSRCRRRSSDTPRTTAPIDKSPTVQFIRHSPFRCGFVPVPSINRSCRAWETSAPGDMSASTVTPRKEDVL